MANNRDVINKAMDTFGGIVMYASYWGKEYDASFAWFVDMSDGSASYSNKLNSGKVRAVASIPYSAE